MIKLQSEKNKTPVGVARKLAPVVYAASFALLITAAPLAHADGSESKSRSGVSKILRMFVKKQGSQAHTISGRSPYICTLSGFGKKGACYPKLSSR